MDFTAIFVILIFMAVLFSIVTIVVFAAFKVARSANRPRGCPYCLDGSTIYAHRTGEADVLATYCPCCGRKLF